MKPKQPTRGSFLRSLLGLGLLPAVPTQTVKLPEPEPGAESVFQGASGFSSVSEIKFFVRGGVVGIRKVKKPWSI